MCQQNLEASKQNFCLPNPFNTQLTIELSEDTNTTVKSDSQKVDATNSNFNNIGNGVNIISNASPKLVRQDAIVTVDVHNDNNQNTTSSDN